MPVSLDKRLNFIFGLADFGCRAADIGCDHGKLAYNLVSSERAVKVIATDLRPECLKKAYELAFANGVQDVMETRLGDGLNPIESREVDTVIIAGLGGDVMADILKRAREEGKEFKHFILSPNTHPEKVRREIVNYGHTVTVDKRIECAGKSYTVIKTDEGESALSDLQIEFGAFYMTDEDFKAAAERETEFLNGVLKKCGGNERAEARLSLLMRAKLNIENET